MVRVKSLGLHNHQIAMYIIMLLESYLIVLSTQDQDPFTVVGALGLFNLETLSAKANSVHGNSFFFLFVVGVIPVRGRGGP
jgi:hypothetical protein